MTDHDPAGARSAHDASAAAPSDGGRRTPRGTIRGGSRSGPMPPAPQADDRSREAARHAWLSGVPLDPEDRG